MANCLWYLADAVPKFGRWNDCPIRYSSHLLNCVWQMLCLRVRDGITTVNKSETYFNLMSEVLNRTSSQICCRWYFSMFLLRYGLLTLMHIDCFIFLGCLGPPFSLYSQSAEIFNCCGMTSDFTVVINREGDPEVFFQKYYWEYINMGSLLCTK